MTQNQEVLQSFKLSQEAITQFQKTNGWIYLIHAEGTELYKIGRSQDPSERLQYLQTGSPMPLRLMFTQWTINCFALEKSLHQIFEKERQHGEWFKLSRESLRIITQDMDLYLYCNHELSFFPAELLENFCRTKLSQQWEDFPFRENDDINDPNDPQFMWIYNLYSNVIDELGFLFMKYLFESKVQSVETYALRFNFLGSYKVHELAMDIIAEKLNANKLPDIDLKLLYIDCKTDADIDKFIKEYQTKVNNHWSKTLLRKTYSKIYQVYITGATS